MPDNFQAKPSPSLPEPGTIPQDRYVDVSFRLPEPRRSSSVVRVMVVFLALGMLTVGLLAVIGTSPSSRATRPVVIVIKSTSLDLGGKPQPEYSIPPGTWVATSVVSDGRPGDATCYKLTLLAKPGRFRLELPNKTHIGDYKEESTLNPKEIDLIDDIGNFGVRGIFKLTDDTLAVCFEESTRPNDFTCEKGSKRTLLVLKRQQSE